MTNNTTGSGTEFINRLINGGFEENNAPAWYYGVFQNLRGWTKASGYGIEIQTNGFNGFSPKSGRALLELDSSGANSNSAMYQDIATGAGQTFQLKFSYMARVFNAGTDTNDIEVWWEGNLLTRISHDKWGWQDYNLVVKATGATSRLMFKATGLQDTYGGLLDDVQLYGTNDTGLTRNLLGTEARDILLGSTGNDAIDGAGNNDKIYAGAGNDAVMGGTGDDVIYGDRLIDFTNNRMANGSFEGNQLRGGWATFNSISGWQKKWGNFELLNSRAGVGNSNDGNNYLELDSTGNSSIYQDIRTNAGDKLLLQLDYKARVWHANSNAIEIWINDVYYTTINESTPSNWKTYEYEISATGSNTRVELRGAGLSDTVGGFIDNVRLYDIRDGQGNDVIRAGAGKDTIYAGAGDDNIILAGAVAPGYYTQDDINNSGGTGFNASAVLSLSQLNGNAVSDAVNGEVVNGGDGYDTLHVYGRADISNITLTNIERIALNSDLTINTNQLSSVTLATNSSTEILEPTIIRIVSGTGNNIIGFDKLGYLQSIERIDIGAGVQLNIEDLGDLQNAGLYTISGQGILNITDTQYTNNYDFKTWNIGLSQNLQVRLAGASATDSQLGSVTRISNEIVELNNFFNPVASVVNSQANQGDVLFISKDTLLQSVYDKDSLGKFESLAITRLVTTNDVISSITELNNGYQISIRKDANVDNIEFNYYVADKAGHSATSDLILKINDVDFAPTARTINNPKYFQEGSANHIIYDKQLLFGNYGYDSTISVISLTLNQSLTNYISVSDLGDRFSINVNEDYNGIVHLNYVIRENDSTSKTATAEYIFSIAAVNDAPIAGNNFANPLHQNEDTTKSYNINQILNGLISDVDGDNLQITKLALADTTNGVLQFNSNTGEFSYTPRANYYGEIEMNYWVTDSSLTASSTIRIVIDNVNDPVIINNKFVTQGLEDSKLSITYNDIIANGQITDVDSSIITLTNFAVVGNNAQIASTANGIVITPNNNFHGSVTVNYTATDGSLSTNGSFIAFFDNVLDGVSLVNQTYNIDNTHAYSITFANILANAIDVDSRVIGINQFGYLPSNVNFNVDYAHEIVTFNPNFTASQTNILNYEVVLDDFSTQSGTLTLNFRDLTAPSFAIASITGDNIITTAEHNAGVHVSGTGEAGSRITLDWGTTHHTATVNASGVWDSYFSTSEIPSTTTSLTAFAMDAAGNVSGNLSIQISLSSLVSNDNFVNTISGTNGDDALRAVNYTSSQVVFNNELILNNTPIISLRDSLHNNSNITSLGSGTYVGAWQNDPWTRGGNGSHIFRIFNTDGTMNSQVSHAGGFNDSGLVVNLGGGSFVDLVSTYSNEYVSYSNNDIIRNFYYLNTQISITENLTNDDPYSSIMAAKNIGNGSYTIIYADTYQNVHQAIYNINGSSQTINDLLTYTAYNSAITSITSGTFAVVLQVASSYESPNHDLYLFQYSGGSYTSTNILVNNNTTGKQINPEISDIGNGSYVVAWESENQDGSGYGVYGRIFNINGWSSSEFLINQTTNNNQKNIAISKLGNGSFFAVWESDHEGNSNIYGRMFNGYIPTSNEFIINSQTSGWQGRPDASELDNGDIAVSWLSDYSASNYNFVTRILDFDNIINRSLNKTTNTIYGLNGNDKLYDGFGNNSLTGGGGSDTFVYGNVGHTMILDYNSAQGDILQFDRNIFSNATAFSNAYNNHSFTITGDNGDIVITFDNNSTTQLILHNINAPSGTLTYNQFLTAIGGDSHLTFG